MTTQRFKVGDRVVVTNPEFVLRVGYPLSYLEAYETCSRLFTGDIEELLANTVFKTETRYRKSPFALSLSENRGHTPMDHGKDFRQLLGGLTKMYMKAQNFGGKERTIHTELRPTEQGKVYEVASKRVCKTGTYDAPYSGQDYNGEWDVYPGGLLNCKTHVLLELGFDTWIESKNVRRVD